MNNDFERLNDKELSQVAGGGNAERYSFVKGEVYKCFGSYFLITENRTDVPGDEIIFFERYYRNLNDGLFRKQKCSSVYTAVFFKSGEFLGVGYINESNIYHG